MGIPDNLAVRLIEAVHQNEISGRALMLGRQNLQLDLRPKSGQFVRNTIAKYYPEKTLEDFRAEDGYAERFFLELGFESIDSMDISDFENASIIADLGADVPEELHEQFDYIYDGGTCEHVFELPTAFRNIDRMLKPGGVFQAHSPSNNFINHGFYQISPEMVFGFWVRSMGYELLGAELVPIRPKNIGESAGLTNPLETNKRPRIKGKLPPGVRLILDYVVRKPLQVKARAEKTLQSDYTIRWKEAVND